MKEALKDDYDLPTPNQQIVKMVRSCGNNLHEVINSEGESFLVSMPTKFRKFVYIKRGDFILVEPISEGDKVKAEMVRKLSDVHIKYYKSDGVWPEAFNKPSTLNTEETTKEVIGDEESNSCSDNDDDIFINPNRRAAPEVPSSSSDSEESDD